MPSGFKRRSIRERVLQILYAYEMNPGALEVHFKEILSDLPFKADKDFATSLVNRVLAHEEEVDEMIKGKVDNWEMNRIAFIDKILLRMGICEFLFFPDIPPKVTINETIEIAKRYSTAGSGKFINGILDSILTELKETGALKKSGRGLQEESLPKSAKK
ncbi:MAG: transcription antitermination factor NusB [Ignavibacteriaceae bacterium]